MAEVLRGKWEAIRLEPPGSEGEGIEFWLRFGDAREYHQVKRQGARRGRWTLRELNDAGVLPAFRSHLTDANAQCVFVSMQGADELRELAERARGAADHGEFERVFAMGEWGSRLSELVTYWPGCTPDEVFWLLKRIHVRTIDEETLRRHAELELTSLVEGEASAASDVLFAYALDAVHQELDSARIKSHLKSRGFNRPVWAEPQALTDVVEAANERYLTFLDRELIRGKLIQRDEGTRVLSALREGTAKRGVILTGGAGAGKSTVLLQVIKSLQQQGVPVLAFRVDRLEPTQRPDEAGRQIRLPASPVATLAALAKNRPCVLVLDQLDAVSLMSGRNPSFFDCFDEMVRQALTQPAMRLLVACRRFDFENDHRLRGLGGRDDVFEMVEVGLLSNDTVRQTVKAMGIDATGLSDHQIRLLSLPAHLKLLADVAEERATVELGFQTANDLYDLYWQRKQALLQHRLGRPVAWAAVIDTLCDYMNVHQILSVPEALVDAHASDVRAMTSEHVLVVDDKRIAFFHEGFFDYAFARRFAARDDDLVGLLRSGEQHLFRRAQVRQILLHEREVDQRRYLETLRTLLASADIRFHIKQVVFALLAQFADPTKAEWQILAGLLDDPEYAHRPMVWGTIRSRDWFLLIDSLGVVESWLKHADPAIVDQGVMLLSDVQRKVPDRVAELVEPYVGCPGAWRRRHHHLVRWADLQTSRRFLELFLRLIEAGHLDEAGRASSGHKGFFGLVYNLPKSRPDWACEAIGRYLDRCLTITVDAGKTNPFVEEGGIRYGQASQKVLIGSAQHAPAEFVRDVLPFVLRTVELNADREGEPPWRDTIWRWRHQDGGHEVQGHVLYAAETALRKLAAEDPERFASVAQSLKESGYATVQFLLIRAYAANGGQFGDEAIDYLCDDAHRLHCGYLDSSHRATRDLIEAASPFCSSERLVELETLLLNYFTALERSAEGRQSRGITQFELLLAVDESRRSATANGRIGEWQRKFKMERPPERPPGGMQWVGPPIPVGAAEKMTDGQWLRAVARYADNHERVRRDGNAVGGAFELSQVLETRVKAEPARFARLVLALPAETQPVYSRAILDGLAASVVEPRALFEACRHCDGLANRPCGSSICRAVEKHADLTWPDDLLDAIAWYATEDPDPDKELWRTEASGAQAYCGGDIHTAGMSSVRGSAARAVCALLFADPGRLNTLVPVLRRMVHDPSVAVRSCAATVLLAVLNHDRDLAVSLLLELCDTEDALLKTRHIEEFIRYAMSTHFARLRPTVERMLSSSDPEVAQAGARQASLAAIGLEGAGDLLPRCLAGSEPVRTGAAQVFSANLGVATLRSVCEAGLAQLFDDPNDDVRSAAAECFDRMEGDTIGQFSALVEGFVRSTSFDAHHGQLVDALERTTASLPAITLGVCERFLKAAGESAGDPRTRADFGADRISSLLVRLYHQTDSRRIMTRCLGLIDDMLELGAAGIRHAIAEFDR